MLSSGATTIREKHTAATRDSILAAAFELLSEHPERSFSHEAIAVLAGVGARTVYRYFPAQSDLYQALWERIRKEVGTMWPTTDQEVPGCAAEMFGRFDRNETLVRSVLRSPAGQEVRDKGGAEGKAAFSKSLSRLMAGRSAAERRRIVAVFVAVYSAPFWQVLRDRGGLSGPDAQAAAEWTMRALLESLQKK